MANTPLLPNVYGSNLRSSNLNRIGSEFFETEDKSVFASLIESLRDTFLPKKLPPLELTSTPIAVVDRMAVKRDPAATTMAVIINGLILMCALWLGARKVGIIKTAPIVHEITFVAPPPPMPKAPPKVTAMGGGGGQKSPVPVTHGNPPKFEAKPMLIPTVAPKIQPKLALEPAINVQTDIKMAKTNAPNIGMANSPLVGMSMGNGAGAGLGAGIGNGMGSGTGGNYGGGVYKIGGGVTQPQVLFAPDPTFTEEARKAKVAGKIVVYLQVSPEGHPMHVRIVHGLGMGLDEKALEAVRQYKFKPAMKDGHPVTVEMNVEVNFQIL